MTGMVSFSASSLALRRAQVDVIQLASAVTEGLKDVTAPRAASLRYVSRCLMKTSPLTI